MRTMLLIIVMFAVGMFTGCSDDSGTMDPVSGNLIKGRPSNPQPAGGGGAVAAGVAAGVTAAEGVVKIMEGQSDDVRAAASAQVTACTGSSRFEADEDEGYVWAKADAQISNPYGNAHGYGYAKEGLLGSSVMRWLDDMGCPGDGYNVTQWAKAKATAVTNPECEGNNEASAAGSAGIDGKFKTSGVGSVGKRLTYMPPVVRPYPVDAFVYIEDITLTAGGMGEASEGWSGTMTINGEIVFQGSVSLDNGGNLDTTGDFNADWVSTEQDDDTGEWTANITNQAFVKNIGMQGTDPTIWEMSFETSSDSSRE